MRSEAFGGNGNGWVGEPASIDSKIATTFYKHNLFGDLIEVQDARQNSTGMWYDGIGQMTERKIYQGGTNGAILAQESFQYEPGGQVSTHVNVLGGTTSKLYTAAGQLKRQENPDGTVLEWRYDFGGRLVKEILSNQSYRITTYDDLARSVTRALYSGSATLLASESSTVDRRGNVITKTDAEGNTFTTAYDCLNRMISATGPATSGNSVQQSTIKHYDAAGIVDTTENGLGEKVVTTKDAEERPLSVELKDATNQTVRITSYSYSPDHQSSTTTVGSGTAAIVTTTYTDTFGKPLIILHADNTAQIFGYDNLGNCLYSFDEEWNVTTHSYDAFNRVSTETLPGGASTTFVYDAAGNVLERRMPQNQTLKMTYDPASRKLTEVLSGTMTINGVTSGTNARNFSYEYYPNGHVFAGLLKTVTDPRKWIITDGVITATGTNVKFTSTYDDFLRLKTVVATGPNVEQNQQTTYNYDRTSRVTSVAQTFIDPVSGLPTTSVGASTDVVRAYDRYGKISNEKVFISGTLHSEFDQGWDGAGRRVSLTSKLAASGSGSGLSRSFAYDPDGAMQQVSTGTSSFQFGFGPNGLLGERSGSGRTQTVLQRDGLGRIERQQDVIGSQAVLVENQHWAARGKRDSYSATRSEGGGWTEDRSYLYNQRGQVYFETDSPNSEDQGVWRYWFDVFSLKNTTPEGSGLGVRSAAVRFLGWADPTHSTDYVNDIHLENYDWHCAGTVTAEDFNVTCIDPKYVNSRTPDSIPTLDALGRSSKDSFKTAVVGTRYVCTEYYDQLGQAYRQNSYPYNSDRQYLYWDAAGRLVKLKENQWATPSHDVFLFTSVYDGLGRRLRTEKQSYSNGVLTGAKFVVDSFYDPQAEFLEVGVAVNGARVWKVYGPDLNGGYGSLQGIGGLEATIDETSGSVTPVVNDSFGNVVGWIASGAMNWNSARAGSYRVSPETPTPQLDAGGSVKVAQASVWRGRRMDATGLYYLGARYYDPERGRFISPDPLGHAASMSLYDYANGDPVNGLDPDGRCVNTGLRAVGSALTGGVNLVDAVAKTPLALAERGVFGTLAGFKNYDFGGTIKQNFSTALASAGNYWNLSQGNGTLGLLSGIAHQIPTIGNFIPGPTGDMNGITTAVVSGGINGRDEAYSNGRDRQTIASLGENGNSLDTIGATYVGGTISDVLFSLFGAS